MKKEEWFEFKGSGEVISKDGKVVTNTDGGDYTCLCSKPIPSTGTHSFTTKFNYSKQWGGFIGIATGNKNLEWNMSGVDAWALRSDGTAFLNSNQPLNYSDSFISPSTVAVLVNI